MRTAIRGLDAYVSVSGQIDEGGLSDLLAAGVRLVINNRPDDEEPGQPSGDHLEAAATAIGLKYAALPIRGLPDTDQAERFAALLAAEPGRVHAFCRSGMRSSACWAMARVGEGSLTPEAARETALAAGYDLSRLPL